jgi:hypothetical protein
MSKINKPVWILFDSDGCGWVYAARQEARDLKLNRSERIVKYIPAPVAPKAPKPAPKPVAVLTDWIDCDTPPARPGVYQREEVAVSPWFFQNWNGREWGLFAGTPIDAAAKYNTSHRSIRQYGKWRGFTTPQE